MLTLIRKAVPDRPKGLNWYHAASPEDRREYDAFGPWIYDVTSEEEMPPRFRSFYQEHRDAALLLKVPRNGERRQLRPGMDLYVAVLAIHDESLTLIQFDLESQQMDQTHVTWDQVVGIACVENLLLGNWILYLADGNRITLDFNSVSAALIDKATDFIRVRIRGEQMAQREMGTNALPTRKDMFFRSQLERAKRRGPAPAIPLHFEPQNKACRNENNRRRRSTGMLTLSLPEELLLIDRQSPTRRRTEAWYVARQTFIPYDRISAFAIDDRAKDSDRYFYKLQFQLDQQVINRFCLSRPDHIIAALTDRGIPERKAQALRTA